MLTIKLAYQNIIGAGIRTWLNVIVLSLSFVAIIWLQGFYIGMQDQATQAMVNSEIGGGQFWQKDFDPYDPFSYEDSHARIPAALQHLIVQKKAVPILIRQATIYPQGRLRPVIMKGIVPDQTVLDLPSQFLRKNEDGAIPALIGGRMAKSSNLHIGDYVTVRWRDAHGTFDAADAQIVQIMQTIVPTIDKGQLWIPLDRLQSMLQLPNEATFVVLAKDTKINRIPDGWLFRNPDYLLRDIKELVKSKTVGSTILYLTLLSLALLAIFDTQVLSIFKRRKEIGTLMALGMTRGGVIRLFTVEGAFHGFLAAFVAALYGLPLLIYSMKVGWALPKTTDSYGFAIGDKLFPTYSAGLVIGTTLLIFIAVTIVSFLPTRRIAKLKPTDALRGKKSW